MVIDFYDTTTKARLIDCYYDAITKAMLIDCFLWYNY